MKYAMRAFLIFILIAGIGSYGIYQYYRTSLEPTEKGSPVIVEIPPGSSTRSIATLLEAKHIIKNAATFSIYVRQIGKGSQLQAGKYQFQPGQKVDQVIDKLAKGEVFAETIQFTIPEGWTVEQIASFLDEKGYANKEKFMNEANHGEFSYPFMKGIPKSAPSRLEGYLFPKTYELKKGATEHEIIDRMLAQFQQEWDPEWEAELKKENLSVHEAVTLASIVEREVAVDKERPIVAGVYFNRLDKGILLQADATVQYALGSQKDRLSYKDLELKSPYNTYLHKGLPPGPIADPGKQSLEAVVHPAKHDYLFYVTKKDGSGEHLFSRTYQGHLKNIALSKKAQK